MGTYVVQDDVRRLEECGSGDIAGQAGDSDCEIRLGSDCREQARRPRVSTTGLSSHLSSRQSPQNKTNTDLCRRGERRRRRGSTGAESASSCPELSERESKGGKRETVQQTSKESKGVRISRFKRKERPAGGGRKSKRTEGRKGKDAAGGGAGGRSVGWEAPLGPGKGMGYRTRWCQCHSNPRSITHLSPSTASASSPGHHSETPARMRKCTILRSGLVSVPDIARAHLALSQAVLRLFTPSTAACPISLRIRCKYGETWTIRNEL